ncbi:GDSL esterase/lipase At5g63170-like [Brassica napus]|uniref:GDSL esterase/lipase At5g63170-like n=1 Tax=Brassica napus TaxID=3708 RepID=UPI002079011A|nr:GDSL esterase/lipase At5g63170-like [Brassica napus]
MTIHIGTIHIGPMEMYAIGGSANLTINSQGNRFLAPGPTESSSYSKASTLAARPSSRVGDITIALGALSCKKGTHADHSPTILVSIISSSVVQAGNIPAVIAFGDSILDTGNNNDLSTLTKVNFYPYGRDFVTRQATGRFGNGRIPTDMIAEGLGVKNIVPAYRSSDLQPNDILTGVSFASGGSGLDPMTAQVQGVIWIPDQLNDFKAYIAKLNSITGDEEKTRSIISNAVYVISAGNNDLGITFVSNPARNTRYTVFSYTNMMISWTQSFMQELYNLGARKFAIMGTLPLGCLPGASNAIGGICLEPANAVARLFNQKLANEVNNLNSVLPGSRSIYIDMYNPLLELVINPLRSGFTWSTWPCCCSPAAPVPCLDTSRHVFWDIAHPTEKAYQTIIPPIIQQIQQSFA